MIPKHQERRRIPLTTPLGSFLSADSLNAEGAAATASILYVRVVELEPRPFDTLDIVHLDPIQIQQAGLIDENLETLEIVRLIKHIRRVLEGHRIAEPGASPSHHGDPQPGWFWLL